MLTTIKQLSILHIFYEHYSSSFATSMTRRDGEDGHALFVEYCTYNGNIVISRTATPTESGIILPHTDP